MIATTTTPSPSSRTCSLLPFIVASLVANAQAAAAVETKPQPVQYKSPAGVEYRSLPDTEAITKARAALAAEPRNVSRIIDGPPLGHPPASVRTCQTGPACAHVQ